MTFIFTPDQINEISIRLIAADETGNYTTVYDFIFQSITDDYGAPSARPKVDPIQGNVDSSVWLWVRGATQVNANDGSFFSDFIRDYTKAQHEFRFGNSLIDEQKIQNASNDIIIRFANDIINDVNRELPTLKETGIHDAGAIASEIFNGQAELGLNFESDYAPWAGTILFPFLGNGGLPGEGVTDSFLSQWVLQAEAVPNPEGGYFKALDGTYDLISIAAVSHSITWLGEALLNHGSLSETISGNAIGEAATLQLLSDLRAQANLFFQSAYGLPDEGRFQIGGDLPLYGNLSSSGADYFIHPNYILGMLGADGARTVR